MFVRTEPIRVKAALPNFVGTLRLTYQDPTPRTASDGANVEVTDEMVEAGAIVLAARLMDLAAISEDRLLREVSAEILGAAFEFRKVRHPVVGKSLKS